MTKSPSLLCCIAAGWLLLIIIAPPGAAQVWQEWVARYDGIIHDEDVASDIAVDPLGNVYVTGMSTGDATSWEDYLTLKYSLSGQELWAVRYNGPGHDMDYAGDLAVAADGDVYVSGYSIGVGSVFDYTTIKYSTSGIQLWEGRYNGPANGYDYAYAIAIDAEENVYVTGSSDGVGTNDDIAVVKYDSAGNALWVACYNSPGNRYDHAYGIAVDGAGNVYVAGNSAVGNGYPCNSTFITVKFNSAGVEQWVAYYQHSANTWNDAVALAINPNGQIAVTGCGGSYNIWPYNFDFITLKYDAEGNRLWEALYNGPGNGWDVARALGIDAAGNVFVTGQSRDPFGEYDYATIKYDSAGIEQWVARYDNGDPTAVVLDSSGSVYVTGEANDDYTTIKYSSSGHLQWVQIYNSPSNSADGANAIAVGSDLNVYITGSSYSWESDYDYLTVKYSQSSPVVITLTPINPPIIIPSTGGSFDYNVSVSSNSSNPQSFSAWIMVQLPDSTWYGPVLGPLALTLPAGTTLSRQRTQPVPASAPAGDYLYEGRVGVYPDSIWDEDSFPFTKLGMGGWDLRQKAATSWGSGEWMNSGDPFPGEEIGGGKTLTLQADRFNVSVNPNPFNAATVLSFELGAASFVNLSIYDVSGRLVSALVNGYRAAGEHEVTFDGSALPSGVYLYRLVASGQTENGKMLLLK